MYSKLLDFYECRRFFRYWNVNCIYYSIVFYPCFTVFISTLNSQTFQRNRVRVYEFSGPHRRPALPVCFWCGTNLQVAHIQLADMGWRTVQSWVVAALCASTLLLTFTPPKNFALFSIPRLQQYISSGPVVVFTLFDPLLCRTIQVSAPSYLQLVVACQIFRCFFQNPISRFPYIVVLTPAPSF